MTAPARSFWITAPGHGELRDEALPAPGPGDAVVRARFSGISRGSESLVFAGRVPESEWPRMRAPFQAGDFPGPVKYGYMSVGEVEDGPAALVGRTAFVLYPHQTRYVVPAAALHVVPDGVPASRAVLAANLETALNGIWDADVRPGDRVAVIGGGTVGGCVAWVAGRIVGCEVELVDVAPARAEVARALGVAFASPEAAARDADVVIHASGSPEGLRLALDLAGDEARIAELSWFGDREVTLPLGGAFHSRRLQIVSSQVGRVPAARRARWDTRRRMALALRLLAEPALDVLISGESPFDELPSVMARLASAPGGALCHRIRY
jgi:threonine dehydrogenase-like Zn-dependent dehydrogenase